MNSVPRIALGVLAAACCFASIAALAQPYDSTVPLTRATVRADLIEWRKAGYDQSDDWFDYPDSAIRAGAIVAQWHEAAGARTGQTPQ
ncbi:MULTISPECIES: DUF4148 domain-containing protein [Paraburkholderia]|uniref:DUF4148 domain-containing protein n=1 Tax=Paraburkholderia youngii TaxID=2782701 RepID=A0A7Y6JWT2_9BURK|nr:DUF4148 domain-containing protein [Paraburkholderia youngii]NUY00187.1 DUF4148 domain-containing protein [Paraburkholderia youngii]